MTVTRAQLPKSLVPGVHEFVGMSYGATPEEHAPLFEMVKSVRAWEEEVMLSGMGGAPNKAEGSSVTFDDIQETWTSRYVMETVAIGFGVTKEAFDDDLYSNIARAKAQELGRSMADTKQVKAAAIFNNGFNANGSYNGGDGVPLFSAAHPTSSGVNFNNTTNLDISETALEDAVIAVNQFKNDRGILISARTESLHIPVQLEFITNKLLKTDYSSNQTVQQSGSNVGGILFMPNIVGGRFPGGIHMNRRFTDPTAWFIKTSVPNGTKMFIREALNGSDETDFLTDNMLFKFRERYAFGWTDPRQWYGNNGS
jgi:hypothetical protein